MVILQVLSVIGFIAAIVGLAPKFRGVLEADQSGRVSRSGVPIHARKEWIDRYPAPLQFLLPPPPLVFWGLTLAMLAVGVGIVI